jgi:hypothetical protein
MVTMGSAVYFMTDEDLALEQRGPYRIELRPWAVAVVRQLVEVYAFGRQEVIDSGDQRPLIFAIGAIGALPPKGDR